MYTFNKYSNFFDVPLESFIIGSIIVDITSQSNLKHVSVNDIKYKCCFVPLLTDKAVVMSLSHNRIIIVLSIINVIFKLNIS